MHEYSPPAAGTPPQSQHDEGGPRQEAGLVPGTEAPKDEGGAAGDEVHGTGSVVIQCTVLLTFLVRRTVRAP